MNRPDKDTPIYNLKAVVQETALKPDTLRAWERRYGIPKPKRTASGHRLYSARDIELLHWLIKRQEEGLSISRAIELWHHAQAGQPEEQPEAKYPEAKYNVEAQIENSTIPDHQKNVVDNPSALKGLANLKELVDLKGTANLVEGDILNKLRQQWVRACLQYDQLLADQLLSQAFALFSIETVCTELLLKGLAAIGDGWYEGSVTVQQEHYASAIAMRRLEALLAALPPASRSGRILICNPPDEEHTFVPLILSLLLRRRGWDVIYLGANVPITSFDVTLSSVKPNLVIVSAQQIYTAATLLEMGQFLLRQRISMAYGGCVFHQQPALQQVIPGHYLGATLEEALQRIDQLMLAPRVKEQSHEILPIYQAAYRHFLERRPQIEAQLEAQVRKESASAESRRQTGLDFAPQHLLIANANMSRTISAALLLGSMDYMNASIAWVKGLLMRHLGFPATQLESYLQRYYEAACNNLDSRGTLILEWFVQELK